MCQSAERSRTVIAKLAREHSPGASMRSPMPLRSAFGAAAIGSKQMHCALRGAKTCAHE
jgi:hypothetical protein